MEEVNHLMPLWGLKNRYLVMRHGKSEANEQGIIISSPLNGINNYGLVEEGRNQIRKSVASALDKGLITDADEMVILASDFKRTMETAEEVRCILGNLEKIHPSKELRERFFGNYERLSNDNYQEVWDRDIGDPFNTYNDVESPAQVLSRTTLLVRDLEYLFSGKTFFLVSHGDALQILITGFSKDSPQNHRRINHLDTAEIRELNLAKTPKVSNDQNTKTYTGVIF